MAWGFKAHALGRTMRIISSMDTGAMGYATCVYVLKENVSVKKYQKIRKINDINFAEK